MSGDNYQAIYNAALAAFDISFQKEHLQQEIYTVSAEMRRPSAIYRPRIYIDGNKWCALYGDNLQDGIAGFGDSPDEAMRAFDRAWVTPLAGLEPRSKGRRIE